jgi:hypothetical protein
MVVPCETPDIHWKEFFACSMLDSVAGSVYIDYYYYYCYSITNCLWVRSARTELTVTLTFVYPSRCSMLLDSNYTLRMQNALRATGKGQSYSTFCDKTPSHVCTKIHSSLT